MTTKASPGISDATLRSRYKRGESMLAMSHELGVSRSTVRRRLIALGVELRSEAGLNPGNARGDSPTLTRLRAVHAAAKAVEKDKVEAVAACRRAGDTWEQIGDAVEQAPPNAWKKYTPLILERTTTKVVVRPEAKPRPGR